MTQSDSQRALSFGQVADSYDRGRPDYPEDAAAWLVGAGEGDHVGVLEVGAGTGKLTDALLALGHDVLATDPDADMLAVLSERRPDARAVVAGVDDLPVPDRSVDVVVGAQCYHWFDPALALPEVARVLRPGGHVSLVWNERDETIPWVRRLGRIIGSPDQPRDPTADLVASGLFDDVEQQTFTHWQSVDRRSILDLARSRSGVVALDDAARAQLLSDLLALYDEYGRGMDGMQLPYLTRCFRARVADLPEPSDRSIESGEPDVVAEHGERSDLTDSASTLPRVAAGPVDDDAVLLFSFS